MERKSLLYSLLAIFLILTAAIPFASPTGRVLANSADPTSTPMPVFTPPVINEQPVFFRQFSPEPLAVGEETKAQIKITPGRVAGCLGTPLKPVDVMMVIDTSDSAGYGPGSNWERSVGFIQALLEDTRRPVYLAPDNARQQSMMGLVTSQRGKLGPEPFLLQPLSTEYDRALAEIAKLSPTGDTDLVGGLTLAAQELTAKSVGDRAKAIVMVLHDNVAINPSTRQAIKDMQSKIPLYIIVNSLNIANDSQITIENGSQLVDRKNILIDPTVEDIYGLYVQAGGGDKSIAFPVLRVRESIAPSKVIGIQSVEGPNGMINEGVTWLIKGIEAGDTINLSYRFRITEGTTAPLTFTTEMAWVDCNGSLGSSKGDHPMNVDGNVPVITSNPGRTPAPTNTPGGGMVVVPHWDLFGLALSFDPRWLWLLLIPLLLLLLWLLWQWLKNRHKPIRYVPEKPIGLSGPLPPHGGEPAELDAPRYRADNLYSDWTREEVFDKQGQPFTLFIRPKLQNLSTDISMRVQTELVLHVCEKNARGGYVEHGELQAQIMKKERFDPLAGKNECWNSIQVKSISVDAPYRRRGLGRLMMKRIERIAAGEAGARDVHGFINPESAQPFFIALEYRLSRNNAAEQIFLKNI